jgi:hypothetical protein
MAPLSLIGIVLVVLVLALVGFLLYIITTKIQMDDSIKQLIHVVIVVFVVLYIIGVLTGVTPLPTLGLK